MSNPPKRALAMFILVLSCANVAIGQTSNAPPPGVYKVGDGVSPPKVIYAPEPEFSEQARKANYQGTVILKLIVGEDGHARDIRLINSVGMGLDEKAVEAVQTWRFEPGRKNGEPVPVEVAVEVDFHLYDDNPKVADLTRRANAGDPKTQLDLAHVYFEGKEVGKNDSLAQAYLYKAANKGLPKAQFELGERLSHLDPPEYPKAYMWLTLAQRAGYKHSHKALKELSAKITPEQQQQGQSRVDNWTLPSK